MEQRLIDLETRLAFQEQTITELNDIVTDQQRRIDYLQAQLNKLREQLASLEPSNIAHPSEETPPPHY